PVAALLPAPRAPRRAGSRRELADAMQQRLRPRHVAEREVIPYRRLVHGRARRGELEQRLDLGGEVERLAVLAQEERLLAETVARDEELRLAGIPDRKGEHAAQALHAALAPLGVGVQQHLGVAVARECVALLLELGAQLAEIVDLAVEGEREAGLLVVHRLRGADRVDDREAAMPEPRARSLGSRDLGDAMAVRAAMLDRGEHALEDAAVERASGRDHRPCDSAHGS